MMSSVPTIKCEDTSPSPSAGAGAGGGVPHEGDADGEGGTYNLSVNVNLSSAMASLLAAEGAAAATLRTPEIVNDVITMTSPLDHLDHYTQYDKPSTFKPGSGNDSNSSMSNGSSATSPSPSSSNTPSIQKTCSELIKAGLKLSIESKRKLSGSDTDLGIKRMKREDSDDDYDSSNTTHTRSDGLTPEDEERRRRRRERNKIAATKCRMKKRERTVNLVTESEVLETQNIDLKAQLKELEVQKRQLVDMLSVHSASCVKSGSYASAPFAPAPARAPASAYDAHSPYLRPESADVLASSYSCVDSLDAMSSFDSLYAAPSLAADEGALGMALVAADGTYLSTDGYLPKSTNVLIPIDAEHEYFDPEGGYAAPDHPPQCHGYQPAVPDPHSKHNNDGCLV